jgi:hypothetical protein
VKNVSLKNLLYGLLEIFVSGKHSPDEEYQNMKKVFTINDELISFLKEQTGCSDITINDKTVLLVDKE